MSQNLSLYEDALQFYLVISTDTGELSESMQFAREVSVLYTVMFFYLVLFTIEMCRCSSNSLNYRNLKKMSARETSKISHQPNALDFPAISLKNISLYSMNLAANVLRLLK